MVKAVILIVMIIFLAGPKEGICYSAQKEVTYVKKFRWNPNLNLNLSISTKTTLPSIGIGLFSYGKTKSDNDLLFLNIYIGGNTNKSTIGISIIQYNIGKHLPLISNTFIGPSIGKVKDETIYGINVSVPF